MVRSSFMFLAVAMCVAVSAEPLDLLDEDLWEEAGIQIDYLEDHRFLEEGSGSYGSYGSYDSTEAPTKAPTMPPTEAPTKAPTAAPTSPPTAPLDEDFNFDNILANVPENIVLDASVTDYDFDAPPPVVVIKVKTIEAPTPPPAGSTKVLVTKEVERTAVVLSAPAPGIKECGSLVTNDALRLSIALGYANALGQADLLGDMSFSVQSCTLPGGAVTAFGGARRLTAGDPTLQVEIVMPGKAGNAAAAAAAQMVSAIQTAASNGNLGKAIKNAAASNGVLTQEMVSAPNAITVSSVAVASVTETISTYEEPSSDDGWRKGDIAGLVIGCIAVGVMGTGIAYHYAQKAKTPSLEDQLNQVHMNYAPVTADKVNLQYTEHALENVKTVGYDV